MCMQGKVMQGRSRRAWKVEGWLSKERQVRGRQVKEKARQGRRGKKGQGSEEGGIGEQVNPRQWSCMTGQWREREGSVR